MWKFILRLLQPKQTFRIGPSEPPRMILTEPAVTALQACLEPDIKQGNEGIAYLLGQSDGTTTLVVSVIRPQAVTTRGSFSVSPLAMALVMRTAVGYGLHTVGQAHTHPGQAYHSEGDNEGARIAYNGYVSVVFPDYGRHLPALDGAAAFMFQNNTEFVAVGADRIVIVPGQVL